MFEWADQVARSAQKDWDVVEELVQTLWLMFTKLPQTLQPIAVLFFLMSMAFASLLVRFVFSTLLKKISEPIDALKESGRAPLGFPPRPKSLNPEVWFEHIVRCQYISNRNKGIGWFASRAVIWVVMMSVMGTLVLQGLNYMGLRMINDVAYAAFCVVCLALALSHGFAHNEGRKYGRRQQREEVSLVKISVFAKAFALPIVVTLGMFGFTLAKHKLFGVAKWAVTGILSI